MKETQARQTLTFYLLFRRLITRIKPGMYMSSWMAIWAVVSACTGLVQNFGGLVACRFFLGITEVSSPELVRLVKHELTDFVGTGMLACMSQMESVTGY